MRSATPEAGAQPLRRLTVPEYIGTVRAAVGIDVEQESRRLFPPDLRADGFSNTAYTLGVDLAHIKAYAMLAEIIVGRMDVAAFASQFSDRRELNDAAMREVIAPMGKWLLRSPLEEHEIAAYLRVSNAVAAHGGNFDVRFRTTKTDGNGLPSLASPSGAVQTRLTHVVFTRDTSGQARLYINGAEQAARQFDGDLTNWDENFHLALANETTNDRPWRGVLHRIALYDRALSPEEVRRNHAAGID